MNRPFRLLVRHFLRRFLDNDLISPNADNHVNTALFLAVLVVPNLLGSVLLVLKYGNYWTTPCERLLLGLTDKLAFLSTSMILTALVAVVQWDALWLDARDNAILRPFPIPSRTLVGAKLAALGLFVGMVAVLANAVPTLLFPLIWFTTIPFGIWFILRLVAVHGLVSLAAAAFAFAAVLGARGLIVTVLPIRAHRAASTLVQFAAILVLVCAFLLSPAFYHDTDKKLAAGNPIVLAWPPTWFLGLYDRLTAGAVLDDPGVLAGKYLNQWQESDEARARSAYLALDPAFHVLAKRAIAGLAVSLALALVFFAFGHLRKSGRVALLVTTRRQARWRRSLLTTGVRLLAGRRPVSRATFAFTLQALARSARHRLYVAGYLAGGIALVVASQDSRVLRNIAAPVGRLTSPEPGLLVLQLVLAFALIVGLRVGFPIPAELQANWIFRVTEPADVRLALAGARRAFRAVAVAFLALLVPWHAALWGWRVAAMHFATGALISVVLVDVLLISFPNLPFTIPYIPGRSKLRYTWPLYLFLFWVVTYLFAFLEFRAMRSTRSFGTFAAFLAAMLIGLAWARRLRLRQHPGLAFDEDEERTVQTLGLMP